MSFRPNRVSPTNQKSSSTSTSTSTSSSISSSPLSRSRSTPSITSFFRQHPLVLLVGILCLVGFLFVATSNSAPKISNFVSMGASSSSSMIHLRTGSIDAVNEKTAVKPAGTWAHTEQKQNTSPTTRDLYLITFTHPIAQEARDRVTSLIEPVKLENYIPDNTFLVYITHQQAGAIASAAHENSPSGIVAVIPLAKIHRVQPNLVKSLEKQDSDMASLNVLLATTYPARTDEETTARAAAIQHALHSVDQNATATMMSHDKIKVTTNKKTAAAVADHLSGMHDVQWIEAVPVHKLQPAASVGHGHGPKLTL